MSTKLVAAKRKPKPAPPRTVTPKKGGKYMRCACGTKTVFGLYVAAHYNELLDFSCDGCGQAYSVRNYAIEFRGLVL